MQSVPSESVGFGARLKLAFGVFFDAGLAARVVAGLKALERPEPKPVATPAPAPAPVPAAKPAAPAAPVAPVAPAVSAERLQASGLAVLAALQREGRLLDFLQQDLTGHPDEDIGAAARVVHAGCRGWLKQSVELAPAVAEAEGTTLTVPAGFDAQRIRLTGRVAGAAPHRGTIRHAGWVAKAVRWPAVSETLDPRVLAPAEVEIE